MEKKSILREPTETPAGENEPPEYLRTILMSPISLRGIGDIILTTTKILLFFQCDLPAKNSQD